MKICYLIGGFTGNGGIGRVTSILMNELVNNEDLEIHAMSFYNAHKPNLYNLDDRIQEHYLFNDALNMRQAMMRGGGRRLRQFLRTNEIDILVICGALYFPLGVLASKGTKTKTLAWEHSNARNTKDHKFQMESRKVGAKFSDEVVTLTKQDAEFYRSDFDCQRVRQIYNPVDASIRHHVRPYASESKKILSIGRLTYQKYFDNLVEVAKLVLPDYPEWTWDIYGEGDDRPKLAQLITDYNLEGRVNLLGQVSDLYDRYPNYGVQVMTSRYEGFPMSLLEGMTNGLPLVSYDVLTGPKEIIEHGKNGFLVEPFDTQVMANHIKELLDDSELRQSFSQENIARSENFQLETIVSEWEELFTTMMQK